MDIEKLKLERARMMEAVVWAKEATSKAELDQTLVIEVYIKLMIAYVNALDFLFGEIIKSKESGLVDSHGEGVDPV